MPIQKKIISNILQKKRGWKRVDRELPNDARKLVLIRFMTTNPKFILTETETEVYPIEDMKIAFYTGEDWVICGPHPLFDFSPLSNKGEFRDNVVVTHWSEVSDDELIAWACRYTPFNSYQKLSLHVDDDHKELIYRAILNAGSIMDSMSMSQDVDEKERELYAMFHRALCDLQTCMDVGGEIKPDMMKNGDQVSKYFKSREELIDYIISQSPRTKM